MSGMIPVHRKELEVLRDLLDRARAPQITWNESAANMRDQAERKRLDLLRDADSHLDELLTRKPD